jgi:surface antigen
VLLMRGLIRALGGATLLGLTACAGVAPPLPSAVLPQTVVLPVPAEPLQCVPYARQVSGVDIRGDAWTWWTQAKGRYARGKAPRQGAVLVLRKTRALPLGHVAVVTRVVHRREILITHANWGASPQTRGRVTRDVRVIDISPGNDWSELRVWNGSAFGKVYPAHGFVYPVATATGA